MQFPFLKFIVVYNKCASLYARREGGGNTFCASIVLGLLYACNPYTRALPYARAHKHTKHTSSHTYAHRATMNCPICETSIQARNPCAIADANAPPPAYDMVGYSGYLGLSGLFGPIRAIGAFSAIRAIRLSEILGIFGLLLK